MNYRELVSAANAFLTLFHHYNQQISSLQSVATSLIRKFAADQIAPRKIRPCTGTWYEYGLNISSPAVPNYL